jgi:putative peptidoglycan lipid II flippase
VVTIVCAVAIVPFAGRLGIDAITLIAIGSLAGGIAQLAIQWPLLTREGFTWRPVLDWRDEGMRRMLALMGPGTIGLAATQVNLLVNLQLASREIGAPSWLNYAFRIMYLPIGLFGVSIGTAVLPTLSRYIAERNSTAARDRVSDGLSLMLMLNVPATVGLIVLAVPIVQLLFERRAFTPVDTAATAAAVQLYALGLVGYSVVRITSPVFYALGRSRTPVAVGIATVAVNAALNITLVHLLGFKGLALGTSIAALFNAATLLVLLRRDLGGLNGRRLIGDFARIALAATAMGVAAVVADRALAAAMPGKTIVLQAMRLGAVIAVALLILAAAARLLRIREFNDACATIFRRFNRAQ